MRAGVPLTPYSPLAPSPSVSPNPDRADGKAPCTTLPIPTLFSPPPPPPSRTFLLVSPSTTLPTFSILRASFAFSFSLSYRHPSRLFSPLLWCAASLLYYIRWLARADRSDFSGERRVTGDEEGDSAVRFTVRVVGRYNVSDIHPDVICEKREFPVKFGGTTREILFTGRKGKRLTSP